MKKVKRHVKKKFLIIFVVAILIVGGMVGGYFYYKHVEDIKILKEKKQLEDIKNHYSEIVEISKDTALYTDDAGKAEWGSIAKGEVVELESADISLETKYFKLKNLDYYVSYNDVKKATQLLEKSDRYKKYIPFNENVTTKENSKLYRDEKLVYTVKESIDVPIIVKDDNGYYVEYLDELLFVKSEDVSGTHEANNTSEAEASSVPVTVYHFIYKEGETCNEGICHSTNQVREHFNYLKTNNFFTMTTTELRQFIEGKLRVPEKSLLVTIDDGSFAWNVVPLLNEFQVNATLFLITYRFPDLTRFESPYLELASHTHNLHDPYGGDLKPCSSGSNRNALLTCTANNVMLEDFKTSRKILNNTEAFCYPLYVYNENIIAVLKDAGFKMAFMGGGYNVEKGINPYKIPRRPLLGSTSMSQYMNIVNS